MLLQKFKECFPEKTYKITSNDQPWISHKLKTMDRLRKREYHKHRKSEKWSRLNKAFKAYARMELVRKLSGFGAPISDLKTVYMAFVRCHCEASCNVWHSGLTLQEENDLERVQKVALKIILKDKYKNYNNALNILDLETLKDRRIQLCLAFAKKCLGNPKMKHLFPPNNKTHTMDPRSYEHFQVLHANTERMKNSPIVYMQNLLNTDIKDKEELDRIWKN